MTDCTLLPHPRSVFALDRTAAGVQAALLGLFLGGLALGAAPALAEDAPVAQVADSQLDDSREKATTELDATMIQDKAITPGDLPPVYSGGQVAYGSRVGMLGDKDFMETPFSTVSYTEKYIADLQAKDITKVIAATDPAVFSNGLSGTYSENFNIRGFASNINDVSFGGLFGMAPYYRTSPEMFERIEVLKGPSALLNGMPPGGSVAGTVNLVPKRAGEQPLTRLTTTYSSDAQYGGHIDVGRRFGEGQAFGVRFNGMFRDGDTATDHQSQKNALTSFGLDWRGERARLSADLYKAEDRIKGQNRGISLASNVAVPRAPKAGTLLNPDWAYVENDDQAVMVRGEYDINDNLMAYAAAGTSKTDYSYNGAISAQVLNSAGDFKTTMGQLRIKLEKQSGEAGLKGHFTALGIGNQWTLNATHYADEEKDHGRRSVPGGDWITNIYNPTWGPKAPELWPLVLHSETRLTSYGLADTLSFLDDQVQLTLGVRRQQVRTDTFNTTTGARNQPYDASANTPAAALLVKLNDNVSLYANYIEGLSKGAIAPLTAANHGQVFAPAKSKQKEVGVKVDLGEFSHTLSLYQIERPSSYTDPVTNIFTFGGEQRNRGVEWSFFGSVLPDLRLMGGVAHVDPKLTKTSGGVNEGKTATGQPKLQGKLGIEWDTPVLEGLTLTGNATSVSKQYISADNTLSIPGYTVFDVGARYATRVAEHPVTLRATVDNVTNKAYWGQPLLSSLGLGAPRTVSLSASVDF